jgi:hypothetical protein
MSYTSAYNTAQTCPYGMNANGTCMTNSAWSQQGQGYGMGMGMGMGQTYGKGYDMGYGKSEYVGKMRVPMLKTIHHDQPVVTDYVWEEHKTSHYEVPITRTEEWVVEPERHKTVHVKHEEPCHKKWDSPCNKGHHDNEWGDEYTYGGYGGNMW